MTPKQENFENEISEADRIDQLATVDPAESEQADPPGQPSSFVNESDWLDQQRVVPLEDDDGELT